ncbi:S41 family peptidase [Candidatus Gottesmanbacteria bacterium]|nr:S41 family peptidase [Candidatus Gottesmanbacteria bacterium]
MKLRTIRNIVISLSFLILFFGFGYKLGLKQAGHDSVFTPVNIAGKNPSKSVSVDFSLFWDVWDRLNRSYIDKNKLDPQKMIYGAISGMVSSLEDPYTVFLTPDQNKEAKDDLGGRFEGIGAQLGIKDKKIVIVAPLKDSPAEKAGLKAGDWIMKVDGKDTSSWTLPQAVSKIRGPKGSKVMLSIVHKEASQSGEVAVVRDEIKVASVEWEVAKWKMEDGKWKMEKDECSACERVVHLKLARFGDQTNEDWNKAVEDIRKAIELPGYRAIRGLIFDLRNNPGGYLSGAVFIASEFLADGTIVIQEQTGGFRQTFTVNRKGRILEIPMIVLINKGSASASEIVAGALKERGRAKIVGEQSFGKGSIQEAQDLSGGAGIHITTAKWLLPQGEWINTTGIEPDVRVENDINKPDEDLQLTKAIETLLKTK